MLNARDQGHTYAGSMEYARLLGFDEMDIQAWVAGGRLEMAQRRVLDAARRSGGEAA